MALKFGLGALIEVRLNLRLLGIQMDVGRSGKRKKKLREWILKTDLELGRFRKVPK